MEVLVVIGLVGNVIQFVDFGNKLNLKVGPTLQIQRGHAYREHQC
jgi:hypothetical protein